MKAMTYTALLMMKKVSLARRTLKRVLPASWRAILRRLFLEEGFHLYPCDCFSRFRPDRTSFGRWLAYETRFRLWRLTYGRRARLERPIFMIGCPRSGTGISVRLFALHPDVANLSEAPDIWDPWHYRDLTADDHWSAADVTPKEAARLHARFEFHRRFEGKERFINKHPPNSVRLDYIRTVFPDAVFIHIVRDGRPVAASIVEFVERIPRFRDVPMPICRPPNWRELVRPNRAVEAALQWRALVSLILAKRSELGPAYHEIRYEALCEDPRGILGAAFRFAGLRADDEVLARLPERLESQNCKWRPKLTPEEIEQVTAVQEPLLKELGYAHK